MSNEIIELAPFKLKPGATRMELLSASNKVQTEFLDHRAGFLRRSLVEQGDGGYADIVVWADQKSAENAMQAVMQSPVCVAYFNMMELTGAAEVPVLMQVVASYDCGSPAVSRLPEGIR